MKFGGGGLLFILVLLEAALAFNCGQGALGTSGHSGNTNNIAITISPSTSAVAAGKTDQLTAEVTGTTETAVTWLITAPASNGGSIDSTGLYTVPANALPNSVTIKAASIAGPSITTYSTIWVLALGKVIATNNPLVAQYSIWTPIGAKAKVDFGPDTSYGLDTWEQPAPSGGGTVNILVAGMRMSSTYHMRAVVEMSDGTQFEDVDYSFQTGSVPSSAS